MWRRIRQIVWKEFLTALREPRMRVVLFVPPMLQLIIFGFAVNMDVEHARLAWMDQDFTPASRDLLAAFGGSPRFTVEALPSNDKEVQGLLDRGDVQVVVRVLPGYARDLARRRTASVQVLVEGSNSNIAALVSSYAQEVIARHAAGLRPLPAGGLSSRPRVWFNAELKSRNYFVPGVIVNIVMIVTLMLTALAVVREKEIGTMEQLMVTPIRPLELMLGKTLPFAIIGVVETIFITGAALLVFRVPLRGDPLLLLFCAVLFLFTTLGAGLFISTISHTQQQAMMATFFFFMPAFALSGFAFPIRNMPDPVRYFTYLNPLRYFIEIVRGIFLKGVGADVLWPQMLALATYGVAVVLLSAARFHKRLD